MRLGLSFITGGARQHADHLTKLFVDGMTAYWARPTSQGPVLDGDAYSVKIRPDPLAQSADNTLDFDIHRTNSPKYVRSHNFGIIDGQIHYNAGFFATTADADARFKYTSAHEFGHTVLHEAGGKHFSWTHKGSTTLFQNTHDSTPKYPPAPTEIDMMNYFADGEPADFYSRVHASNDDILRLVSLGSIKLT